MPPELRLTPNGKQVRPKPPPVPGSARKTRAAAAADAKAEEEKAKAREEARQKERESRKTKSKSKEKETTPQPSADMDVDEQGTGKREQNGVKESKKAAFSFAAPPKDASPAPSLFTSAQKAASPIPAPAKEQAKAPPSLFSFTPPPVPSHPPAPVVNGSGSERKDAKEQATSISTVALPAYSLYEMPLSFSSAPEDAKIKAIKAAVLEIPLRELPVYSLL